MTAKTHIFNAICYSAITFLGMVVALDVFTDVRGSEQYVIASPGIYVGLMAYLLLASVWARRHD